MLSKIVPGFTIIAKVCAPTLQNKLETSCKVVERHLWKVRAIDLESKKELKRQRRLRETESQFMTETMLDVADVVIRRSNHFGHSEIPLGYTVLYIAEPADNDDDREFGLKRTCTTRTSKQRRRQT